MKKKESGEGDGENKQKKHIQSMNDLLDQHDYRLVDCDLIDVNPNQDRRDWTSPPALQKYADLKASIVHDGQANQAIEVRPTADGRYELIVGERRLRVYRDLRKPQILAVIRHNISKEQASLNMLTENEQHFPLSQFERALAFRRRMEEFDWSANDLASRIGIDARRIYECLSILKLDKEILDLVEKHYTRDIKVIVGLGRLKDKSPEAYRQGLALFAKNELNRATLKSLKDKMATRKPPVTKPVRPRHHVRSSRWSFPVPALVAYPMYCKYIGSSSCDIDPNSEEFERIFTNFIQRLLDEL